MQQKTMGSDTDYRTEEEEEESEVEDVSAMAQPRDPSPYDPRIGPGPQNVNLSDKEYVVGDDESLADRSSNSDNNVTSLKRTAEDAETSESLQPTRPSKRPKIFKRRLRKGRLVPEYLSLLNAEIQAAAQRINSESLSEPLEPSQLGLTCWSSIEKHIFFESLARLGRDNLEGIAASIGSKSVIEVRHYIHLIEEELARRKRTGIRRILTMVEYPSAVELSPQCCRAVDETADAIGLKEDEREQQREEGRWGSAWNLTPEISMLLREGVEDIVDTQALPSVELLHLSNWLQLSQRIFMNSSVPGGNWEYIDDGLPSIWATTFEDFRSLAISFTRRLVQTSIFAASTRRTGQRDGSDLLDKFVKRMDVQAAAASLGLPANSRDFWRKSARRLRIDVYDEVDEDGEPEIMSYEEVEEALSGSVDADTSPLNTEEHVGRNPDEELEDLTSEEVSDGVDEEEKAIAEEAKEVLLYSVAEFPSTSKTKESLGFRIAVERQQEQHAEECDQYASYKEELEVWKALRMEPPEGLTEKAEPGPGSRSNRDVGSVYPLGRDWRSNTRYFSEWEVASRADQDGQ